MILANQNSIKGLCLPKYVYSGRLATEKQEMIYIKAVKVV